jgi:CDP-4-dehydro-6-deoxyglucose reductase
MALYWGGRKRSDLYLHDLAQRWSAEHGVRFVPVLSDPLPDDAWQGRTGLVHKAVMEDCADLSGFQIYACGNPLMVEAARTEFTALCGLPEDEFFCDAFTAAAEGQPAVG